MQRRTLLLSALAAGCAPSLGTFDALAPRDGGVRRIARDIAYGEGARRTLDIYAPAGGAGPLPVLVFFYGGSWRSGDKDDYEFMGAALAAQGFLTIIPDYRLTPEVRFPGFVEDCAAATTWVAENAAAYGGDAERIVLMGHSAGAYNAMMLALDPSYLRAAGADADQLRGVIGLAGPYDFLPFDVEATQQAFGQAPDAAATQPINFARAGAPPLLLLWGDEDTTVGPRNLQSLEAAMQHAGGEVETTIYPGVDHIAIMLALSRPFRGRAPVLRDVTAFARRVSA